MSRVEPLDPASAKGIATAEAIELVLAEALLDICTRRHANTATDLGPARPHGRVASGAAEFPRGDVRRGAKAA